MSGCGGSPPRDPDLYKWSKHFKEEAMPSPYRFLTQEMVDETIIEGRDCDRIEAGPGNLRRRLNFDGVDAVLVLPEDKPIVITGWTEVDNVVEALSSGRWTQDQLAKMQAAENLEHKPGPNRDEMCESEEYPNWYELGESG